MKKLFLILALAALPAVSHGQLFSTIVYDSSGEITIATGAVTATGSHHTIDTESDAASDDLDTLTFSGAMAGLRMILRPADGARTVVLKDGTGNIQCAGGADISLDDAEDWAYLLHDGTNWIAFDMGAAPGAFSDAADPIVQKDTTKDVRIGDDVTGLTGKVEVGGDADQPQLIVEGHSTQTDDILIIRDDGASELFTVSDQGDVYTASTIYMQERTAAKADTAARGQVWVKNTTPNELWFTDDAGTDFQLGAGGGTGTLTTLKEDGAQIGGADIVTLDFLGADFDLTETPDTEINIVAAAALTRDSEWTGIPFLTSAADGTLTNETAITASADLAGILSDEIGAAGNFARFNLTGHAQGDVYYFDGTDIVNLGPGTAGQFLQTQGAAADPQWAAVTAGSVDNVILAVRKGSAGTITQGTPVYLSGWNAGGWAEIEGADSDGAGTMPAIGIATQSITNAATVDLPILGKIEGMDTSAFSVQDALYVSDTGTLTSTRPGNTDDKIQKIGIVIRSHASQGVIEVAGAFRSNDVPNLQDGYFWMGNGSNIATAVQASGDVTFDNTGVATIGAGAVDLTNDVTGALPVGSGGSGGTTFTDGGILLGSGTAAFTATSVLGNGEMLIGDGAGDPTVATLTGTANQITVTNGAGSITLSTPQDIGTASDVQFGDLIAEGTLDVGTVETFTDSDATPDVSTGAFWNTNTSAVTITDFDGAGIAAGQKIWVTSKGAITFDVTASGLKGGTTDIVTASGDVTQWLYDGADWYLVAFADQSDDLGADADSGGSPALSAITDPVGDANFTLGDNETVSFQWTGTMDSDGGLVLSQHTGNPVVNNMLFIQSTDTDIRGINIDAMSDEMILFTGSANGTTQISFDESVDRIFVDANEDGTKDATEHYVDSGTRLIAILEDQQTSGTHGGTATSGSWETRTINTEVYDANAWVSISSNQFTFAENGTYLIKWSAVGHDCGTHQSRLYSVDETAVEGYGTSEREGAATGTSKSEGSDVIVVTGTGDDTYRLEHQVASTQATDGYGRACSFGTEVYVRVEIYRVD